MNLTLVIVALVALNLTSNSMRAAEPAAKDSVHTPSKNSAERKALLEAVHRNYAKNDPSRTAKTVEFVVPYLKVHNGWAWIEIHPKLKDGSQQFESQSELYQMKYGTWTFVGSLSGEADADPAKDIADLKKLHPAMPHDILPKLEKP